MMHIAPNTAIDFIAIFFLLPANAFCKAEPDFQNSGGRWLVICEFRYVICSEILIQNLQYPNGMTPGIER